MKYSFLMPFFDRSVQLWNTLLTFERLYSDRDDFEIIVVVDNKTGFDSNLELNKLVTTRFAYLCPIGVFPQKDGDWFSPSAHYNVAAQKAIGEYLILTSPEVMHKMDVLFGYDLYFDSDPSVYVIAACINSKRPGKMEATFDALNFNVNGAIPPWYQHTEHRPSDYHFCSALHRDTFDKVDGFDEEFGRGVGYDDNDFRDSLIVAEVPFIRDDSLVTVHQAHSKVMSPQRRALTRRNRDLYAVKCEQRGLPMREN